MGSKNENGGSVPALQSALKSAGDLTRARFAVVISDLMIPSDALVRIGAGVYEFQSIPYWVSRSKIVPLTAGSDQDCCRLVTVRPDAVPANRNRRLGYVWARTEEKYRWPIGKWAASE